MIFDVDNVNFKSCERREECGFWVCNAVGVDDAANTMDTGVGDGVMVGVVRVTKAVDKMAQLLFFLLSGEEGDFGLQCTSPSLDDAG